VHLQKVQRTHSSELKNQNSVFITQYPELSIQNSENTNSTIWTHYSEFSI